MKQRQIISKGIKNVVHVVHEVFRLSLVAALFFGAATELFAQAVVPGTGRRIVEAGDDFEDEDWTFTHNFPKSSYNIDKRVREPRGSAGNGLWMESSKRGQPDIVKRIPTPKGGLPGSQGALLIRSLNTGVPGRPGWKGGRQQDDLIMNMQTATAVPVSWSPSVVVRVFLPPFEQWDASTDVTFGLRASVTGIGPDLNPKPKRRRFGLFSRSRRRNRRIVDVFYPGIFIQFNSQADQDIEQDSAVFIIRADEQVQDVMGPEIKQTGWWTLGMSFTPDGRVHYYVSPGVDDLTEKDHVGSYFSQSVRCQSFNTIFFNIISRDDGRNWSTPWVIDDPSLYYGREDRQAGQPRQRR